MPTHEEIYTQIRDLAELGLSQLHPPPRPPTITVPAGSDLQAAIDAAPTGAILRVAPGVYDGIVLPGRTAHLVIRPDTSVFDTGTPARITPDMAEACITLRPTAPNGHNIATEPRATAYTIIGVCGQPGDPGTTMAELGAADALTTLAVQPDHIVLDRCLFVAHATKGGKRAIAGNTRALTVVGCHASGFWAQDDAQAFCAWNGPGPFVLHDNYLEASGENILFGGADSAHHNMMPAHATITRNYCTKPVAWQGLADHVVKNILEFKALSAAVVIGNVFEHCWVSGQSGYGIVFTPRNQGGNAPWSTVTNITFKWNVLRHSACGFNLLGTDNERPSGRLAHIVISDNLMYGLDAVGGRWLQMTGGPLDVHVARNTGVNTGNSFLTLDSPTQPADGLTLDANVLPEGGYGMIGSNCAPGTDSWNMYTVRSSFINNLIQRTLGVDPIPYPGTGTVLTEPGVPAVGSDYKLIPPLVGFGVDVDELQKHVGVPL
jgi:hypothetical protein